MRIVGCSKQVARLGQHNSEASVPIGDVHMVWSIGWYITGRRWAREGDEIRNMWLGLKCVIVLLLKMVGYVMSYWWQEQLYKKMSNTLLQKYLCILIKASLKLSSSFQLKWLFESRICRQIWFENICVAIPFATIQNSFSPILRNIFLSMAIFNFHHRQNYVTDMMRFIIHFLWGMFFQHRLPHHHFDPHQWGYHRVHHHRHHRHQR